MSKDFLGIKVTLDSRLVKKGDFFVPVVGENFDGNKFIKKALDNGAKGVIEEEDLYKLAKKKLKHISPTVIAVTGSVGKSSTTRFIGSLLASKYEVGIGSLNTKLGLAVNIINDLSLSCEFFIAECGMDRKGELFSTGTFINPDVAVLTSIGISHAEKLGDLEDIKDAKSELLKTLSKEGVVFYNRRVSSVREVVSRFPNLKKVPYGYFSKASRLYTSTPNLIGQHQKINAHGAYKVAKFFGVNPNKALLNSLEPLKGRLRLLDGMKGSLILDDTYNASPDSVLYALKTFIDYSKSLQTLSGRKVLVLGHMAELGKYTLEGHYKVGDFISKNKKHFDLLIVVGNIARNILESPLFKKHPIESLFFEDSQKAGVYLKKIFKPNLGDLILFKGSQSARIEKAIKPILKNPRKASQLLVRQDVRWM